jgi:hypothetical protein
MPKTMMDLFLLTVMLVVTHMSLNLSPFIQDNGEQPLILTFEITVSFSALKTHLQDYLQKKHLLMLD